MALTEIDDNTITNYQHTLSRNIKSNTNAATATIIAGVLMMISGIAFAIITSSGNIGGQHCFYECYSSDYKLYSMLIITLIAEIGAVILFMVYKNCLKQADHYKDETIVLRDLTIAIRLNGQISGTDTIITTTNGTKTEKVIDKKLKMQEQIMETLLARCTN
jgi:hypothetical protein